MIVTGEASGDLHGANLIRAAQVIDPELSFFGVGGEQMAAAGCEIIIPGKTISVMGIVEVIGHFPIIWQTFQHLKKILQGEQRPDLLILIDFPDFNLRLAAVAKKLGIPVLYYVSPQVWAWRRGRVKHIAKVVDRLAAILPFEPPLYAGLDIDVEYVGNPLTDQVQISEEREPFLRRLGIPSVSPVVGLFPGSRGTELRYNLSTLLATARIVMQEHPSVHFLVPAAATLGTERLSTAIAQAGGADLPLTLVAESVYDVANASDAVLAVSGTVTLQVALVGTPLLLIYRVAPMTYAIGRHLIKVPFIGLPNIIAGQEVAREFVQDAADPQVLGAELNMILANPLHAAALRQGLALVREKIGPGGCSQRVAQMAVEMSRGQIRRKGETC
ncbi:MAG: lipid-A-disaccharide synthase [Deltaproteobacteria bacterium HGW-Deltaproteobacteria-4]|nr:MAG: lipid-A-disaccharide synthase [Deltaproteobacteria bacterium HGW-Deltaproteobacteria-4]